MEDEAVNEIIVYASCKNVVCSLRALPTVKCKRKIFDGDCVALMILFTNQLTTLLGNIRTSESKIDKLRTLS